MDREQHLKETLDKIDALKQKSKEYHQKYLDTPFGAIERKDYSDIWLKSKTEAELLEESIISIKNSINCTLNGGEVTSIEDKLGHTYDSIPDFRRIETTNISFDEDNILGIEKPKYIPLIDEKNLALKGYVFDAIRIDKDSYLLCTKAYSRNNTENNFVLTTLDQLVLSLDYYTKKAKALNELEAEKRSANNEAYWDKLPDERRELFLNQKGLYFSLPAKIKKTITQSDYELKDWREKEKIYKFYKRYRAKKLISKLEDNKMWSSFHDMYQQFVNPNAHRINAKGELQVDTKSNLGLFGNPETFEYWYWFRDMLDFKIKDIKAQRIEISETYQQAIETSFGESNTNNSLKDEFGILVKRQNGDPINPVEIEQIRDAWSLVQKTFGNLKTNSNKHNIKVSHSGNKLIFASKAIGVYIKDMGTIGISNKYGDGQFKSTMSHEVAHFIDNFVGELNGKRWASDDYEGTAGKIAFTFRNNMNKPKSEQTDYVNATKECFARAFQQYFGLKNYGENAEIAHSYIDLGVVKKIYFADDFVSLDKFNSLVKPIIELFLEENSDVFSFGTDIDGTNDITPIGSEITETNTNNTQEIINTIEGLELIVDDLEGEEKEQAIATIEGLKMLVD